MVASLTPRGFHGKLPSRGDFISRGLAREFLAPWEEWVESAMSASRALLGEGWHNAWMVAPVWRFALPGAACGPDAVLGVMLPSIDKVGRVFPLTIVALFPFRATTPNGILAAPFLDAIEDAARDAIAGDLEPEALVARIAAAPDPVAPGAEDNQSAHWWTEGAPSVPAACLTLAGLPPMPAYAGLLAGGQIP